MKNITKIIVGLLILSSPIQAEDKKKSDIYYISDPVATSTAISDASGEIAQIEADAFGSPLIASSAPVRYTGKPYDSDLGAFVFPHRNYRPGEARWMSADPSGFPDGVNNHRYLDSPLSSVDPLGLLDVNIWSADSSTSGQKTMGHASATTQSGNYISWWPKNDTSPSLIFDEKADKSRTFSKDSSDEGRAPDYTIHIDGLDESKVDDWWNGYKNDPGNDWNAWSSNCSDIIAEALRQGGKKMPTKLIWTPAKILQSIE